MPVADIADLLNSRDDVAASIVRWAGVRNLTSWLATLYKETKTRGMPSKLDAYLGGLAAASHFMTIFDLHCISLMMHVDVWLISPVWDGPPEFPLQLRASHPHWKVPASEVALRRGRASHRVPGACEPLEPAGPRRAQSLRSRQRAGQEGAALCCSALCIQLCVLVIGV